ncbi:GNAT family N-acetyltransferase [Sphingomonas sp. 2R-10]|nr:GNAT family N-acetyltransferase [Sphingomonas sp. 2R-10]MDJ0276035.1 GNAT family N-acetyltransferase [Sphingomonas sp. 2R-10]
MASTLSSSTSSPARPLSSNLSRNSLCLRAEAATIASAYTYMPADELAAELADGVTFSGIEVGARLAGVMGVQRRHNVDLIRHAYVLPEWQGRGVGSRLLNHLCHGADRPVLIGTWAAADWAIRFYERHGFKRVAGGDIAPLLRTYWNAPGRE